MSSLKTRYENYKEEMEMNLISEISKDDTIDLEKEKITVLIPSGVKKYIPSLSDEEVSDFGIIAGKLYFIGDDEMSRKAAKNQGIEVIPDNTSVEDFTNYIENLALEKVLLDMAGNHFIETVEDEDGDEVTKEVGIPLQNKSKGGFNDTNAKWKIITEVDNNQNVVTTYGFGWYYVQNGATIPNIGTLKNSYIINYTKNRAVMFDPTKHSIVANGSNVGVQDDSLLFNIDPTNMENGTAEAFGSNISLYGFDSNSGWKGSYFLFDGVNDYLEISTSGLNFENGVTFDVYGKIDDTSGIDTNGDISTKAIDINIYKGLATGSYDALKLTLANGTCYTDTPYKYNSAVSYHSIVANGGIAETSANASDTGTDLDDLND